MSTDHEINERAGLGATIQPGSRPAVLVVDFTVGFTDPECPLGSKVDAEVAATRTLLDAARVQGIPIFFTAISYEPTLADAGLWVEKLPGLRHLAAGTKWASTNPRADVDKRLGMRDDETLIVKKAASAFFGTNLNALLSAKLVDTVIICGGVTSGCVRATAIDVMQYGFRGIIPRDCVADRAPKAHESNLFDIQATSGEVVALTDVLDYLERFRLGQMSESAHQIFSV